MLSLLFLLFLLVCFGKEGSSFLTVGFSSSSKTSMTYSFRLYAYQTKSGQTKAVWNRHREVRLNQANEEVRQALNIVIRSNRIKAKVYPDKRLLTATNVYEVDLAHDLSHARISVAVRGNSVEKRKVYVWLCENIIAVRYALAAEIKHWKRIPTLAFTLVDPGEEIAVMYETLEEEEEDEEREKARLEKIRAYKVANNIPIDDADIESIADYPGEYFSEEDVKNSEPGLSRDEFDDLMNGFD